MADENAGKPEDDTTEDTDTTETETQEEGTSTDESSQGSSTKAKGDKAKSGEEEPEGTLFFNPNEVPEELKPTFRRMQASITKKHQLYSRGIRKAEAFDKLVSDPDFRTWMDAKRSGRTSAEATDDGDSGEAELTNEQRRIQQLEMDNMRRSAADEFKAFSAKYPQWENYQEDIAEAMQDNPHLNYEQAFKLVAFEDASKPNGITPSRLTDKKRANTSKPGSVTSKGAPAPRARSIREAFEQAKKDLGVT